MYTRTRTHTHIQASEGFWSNLFLSDPSGEVHITKHQILLDVHFELPKGWFRLSHTQEHTHTQHLST